MKLTTTNKSVVEEVPYGVYVWQLADGRWIADNEGNFLSISSMKGDLSKIKLLSDAVRHYGVDDGGPIFLAGHRKIDDEEYERQRMRMKWGLVPDEHDIPALREG